MKIGSKLGLVLALAASGAVMSACGGKPPLASGPTSFAASAESAKTGLDKLENREVLAQKFFAAKGFTNARYSETGTSQLYNVPGKEYTDCYYLQSMIADDNHLYRGCVKANTYTETMVMEGAPSDKGIRVSTLQSNPAP
jgi:hypothetical protein